VFLFVKAIGHKCVSRLGFWRSEI